MSIVTKSTLFVLFAWLGTGALSVTLTLPNHVNPDNLRPQEVTNVTILGTAADGATTIAFVEQDSLTTATETAVIDQISFANGQPGGYAHFIETDGPLNRECTMGADAFVCVATSTRLSIETISHKIVTHTSLSEVVTGEPATFVVVPTAHHHARALLETSTDKHSAIATGCVVVAIGFAILCGILLLRERRLSRLAKQFPQVGHPEMKYTETA